MHVSQITKAILYVVWQIPETVVYLQGLGRYAIIVLLLLSTRRR